MVTGQLPMEESESKDMLKKMLVRSFGAIKPIAEHPYAPDEDLCAIIEKMMKIDLKVRYQTMDEVVADLERYKASITEGGEKSDAASQKEEDEFASIFALPPEPAPAPEQAAEAPPPAKAVPQRSVLCVEAQDEIQDVLRKTLTKMGYRALLVGDAERAAERYREAPVDAVIFDADGQGADSIEHFLDMHEKAHEDEHQLVALVILGPRQGDLREKLPTDDRLAVLSKPIKMKDVQDAIHRLLPAALKPEAGDGSESGSRRSRDSRSIPSDASVLDGSDHAGPCSRGPVMAGRGPVASSGAGAGRSAGRPPAEARAVEFLSREVPRWSRENHCFSCHNNGDAARALYEASRAGLRVPADAMAGTTAWLARPSGWDQNGGEGPFSDKRLARVAFTSALADRDPGRLEPGSRRPARRRRSAGARPGRRRLLDARGRGIARLAGGLRPRAGHVPGPRGPGGCRPGPVPRRHRPRRRLADAPGAPHGRGCLGRTDGHGGCRRPACVGRSPTRGDGPAPSRPVRRRRLGALRRLAPRDVRHGPGAARPGPLRRFVGPGAPHDRPRPRVPDRRAAGRRELGRDHPSGRRHQLRPADLHDRLGHAGAAGHARSSPPRLPGRR